MNVVYPRNGKKTNQVQSGWSKGGRCEIVDEAREMTQGHLVTFILSTVRPCFRSFTWRVVCTSSHFIKSTEDAVR